MPGAVISIQCLCLFVRDTNAGVVHVIMPSTRACHGGGVRAHELLAGEQPDGAAAAAPVPAIPRHTARIVWGPSSRGPEIEGWALVLGGAPAPANTDLTLPAPAGKPGPVLVDLTKYTGGKVPKSYVADAAHPDVAARITLKGGKLLKLDTDEDWKFAGDTLQIAHKVVWKFDSLDEFRWVPLGATGPEPAASLDRIGLKNGEYRFTVRCVVETAAAAAAARRQGPVVRKLPPDEVALHFGGFYPLVRGADSRPVPEVVPKTKPVGPTGEPVGPPGVYIACRSAQAKLGS